MSLISPVRAIMLIIQYTQCINSLRPLAKASNVVKSTESKSASIMYFRRVAILKYY